jgi:hypothetical protein
MSPFQVHIGRSCVEIFGWKQTVMKRAFRGFPPPLQTSVVTAAFFLVLSDSLFIAIQSLTCARALRVCCGTSVVK